MEDIPEFLTEEQFYTKALKKSNSVDSEKNRRLHMAALKRFCLNAHKETIEEAGKVLSKQNNVRKTCTFLNQFIDYLGNETGTMRVIGKRSHTVKLKPKSATSIPRYVTTVRSYLKLCHGVRINDDDLKDYVDFPTTINNDDEEEVEPFKKDELKLVIGSCMHQRRKSMYLFMSQTGSRISETLQIKKKYFDFTKTPTEIRLPKIITKGKKQGRTNYLGKDITQRILLLVNKLNDDDLVFTKNPNLVLARNREEQYFRRLCTEIGYTKRYAHNNRFKKNIHSIRAFCMTEYALANNNRDLAHGYIGHSKYLDQYMRLDDATKIHHFKRAEPRLDILNEIVIVEHDQQDQIKELEQKIEQNKDSTKRLEHMFESFTKKQELS